MNVVKAAYDYEYCKNDEISGIDELHNLKKLLNNGVRTFWIQKVYLVCVYPLLWLRFSHFSHFRLSCVKNNYENVLLQFDFTIDPKIML